MKFGRLVKRAVLCSILLLLVVTIIPLIFSTIQIGCDGYKGSLIDILITEIEN